MHRDLTIGEYFAAINAERKYSLLRADVEAGYTVRFAIRRVDGKADNAVIENSEEIAPNDGYFATVKAALDAGEREVRARVADFDAS
jgi:hypothetical protein